MIFLKTRGIHLLREWFKAHAPDTCRLEVLRLSNPHGLNNALLQGYKLATRFSPNLTLTMDADGQDDPVYLPHMLELAGVSEIVFAIRGKRSESASFRFCYFCFQTLMKIYSGQQARTCHYALVQHNVLAHVANLHDVDYFGAMLNATLFSRQHLAATRRDPLCWQD